MRAKVGGPRTGADRGGPVAPRTFHRDSTPARPATGNPRLIIIFFDTDGDARRQEAHRLHPSSDNSSPPRSRHRHFIENVENRTNPRGTRDTAGSRPSRRSHRLAPTDSRIQRRFVYPVNFNGTAVRSVLPKAPANRIEHPTYKSGTL